MSTADSTKERERIMNADSLDFPKGFEGPAERKWIKFREGDTPDLGLLSNLLKQASSTL